MASIPRRTWVFRIGMLLAAGVLSAQPLSAGRLPLVWPTPNRAFLEGKPFEDYIQPTSSGRIESGLFGCTRNGGSRFHEGVDLKTVGRDSRGRATDPVFAAMPGAVVHINRVAGNSSYGIYVVLRHNHDGVRFYTLYSHLASVADRPRHRDEGNAGHGSRDYGDHCGGVCHSPEPRPSALRDRAPIVG